MQLDFLVAQGLKPDHTLLDLGCGGFRAGVHLIGYLDPGNYYGFDINGDLMEAGYERELNDDQRSRVPMENLRVTDRFDADFGVRFDMAIAQSVFTHLTLNSIRLCLYRLAKVMKDDGRLFATFFEEPPNFPLDGIVGNRHTECNVYWQYRDDLYWAARYSPWEVRYIGDWNHPRDQVMMEFTRLRRTGVTPD